ncbi:type II secretion system minor pseudopilin GspJ [Serratia sp. 2723]|uniref:type II secretion system minor pseudopilin GspJ n=1 Tax=unclassified Serratia (in: enterobacteria) TaxID=2647522 RepID=UPI003D1B0AE1
MDEITLPRQRQKGFTLIEMMLAIAIFALLSLMATQILRSILQTNQRVQEKTQEMTQIQLALALMERDISQATVRPAADESRPNLADFIVVKGTSDEIELVHRHWANPGAMIARSSLERVKYRLRAGQLERLSFPTPEAPLSQARIVPVLQGVERFQLRFSQTGAWQDGWYASAVLPQAIEVTVELPKYGSLRRIILLAEQAL